MKTLLIIVLSLIIFGLVGNADISEERNQSQVCNDMIALYKNSNGDLGWPKEACNN